MSDPRTYSEVVALINAIPEVVEVSREDTQESDDESLERVFVHCWIDVQRDADW